MMKEFAQKRGLSSRRFTLLSDKIIIQTSTLSKNNKYEIKLDRLGLNVHYQSDNTILGKIFLVVCVIIIAALTVSYFLGGGIDKTTLIVNYFLWTLIGVIAYFKQHQDDIWLVGGQASLQLYRNIPNEKTVLDFLEEVKNEVRTYLKSKYTSFDKTTSEQDFYSRINWLRDIEVISQAEYVEYKSNFNVEKLM
jgi:hypothetical protein